LSEAVRTLLGLRIRSARVTRVVLQRAPSRSLRETPVSLAAVSMAAAHSDMTMEPSLLFGGASNFVLPRWSTAAMHFSTCWTSSGSMPIVCIAAMRRSNISTSSTSFRVRHVERVR